MVVGQQRESEFLSLPVGAAVPLVIDAPHDESVFSAFDEFADTPCRFARLRAS